LDLFLHFVSLKMVLSVKFISLLSLKRVLLVLKIFPLSSRIPNAKWRSLEPNEMLNFLLFFSVADRISFENIKDGLDREVKEILFFCWYWSG
jgi:hypothetical protein